MMIDQIIAELVVHPYHGLVLSTEQVKALRLAMATYALAVVMDSAVRQEAEVICQKSNTDL
jgi:hypothetical protein